MSATGTAIAGRYRLDAPIAAGGVGEVWRATDLVLGRAVALKMLRPELAGHGETVARFRAEAQHAGSISHPGIAQVYDFGEDDGRGSLFLVMELVDGLSLAELLREGPLDPARTVHLIAQVADGLAAAHAANLVHRDIKPGNLLLGPGGRVKITDFGIAHAAWSAPLTGTGMLVGTPSYLAPERVTGQPATPASDLYSLGIVGYECLTGAPPFTGNPVQVAAAHTRRDLPPLPAEVPAAVSALIGELTAKDPAARPASAAEVADRAGALRDALGRGRIGGPGTSRLPLLRPEPRPPAADPPPASALGAPGSAAGAPGAVPGTAQGAAQGSVPEWTLASAGAQPEQPTLAQPALPAAPGERRPGRRAELRGTGPRRDGLRRAVLATLLAVVLAGTALLGWQLVRGSGKTPAPPRATSSGASGAPVGATSSDSAGASTPPGGSDSSTPAAQTVEVNADQLTGQPATIVLAQLVQLGLIPQVQWVRNDQQPPGTVLSVEPSGQVQPGSTVVITVGYGPGRHGHDGGQPPNTG